VPLLDLSGRTLAYDDRGHRPGRPVAVLLHGWCSSRADLRALGDALVGTYRVLASDAAGHGDSDVPDDVPDDADARLAVPAQAADVAALCDALGVRDALLVGHGSGGAVAVELAAQRPDLAAAVVALDATLLLRAEVLDGVRPLLDALDGPGWREAVRGFVASSHLPSDDPALLAAALAAVDRMRQDVVAAVPRGFLAWDDAAALRALSVPLLHVDATQTADLDRLVELVPSVALARSTGVGHVQLVGRPAQAVAAIEDFVAATTGRRPVDNRAAVLALFDAVEADRLDRIDDLVSADFVDHGAPPGLVEPGPEGYRTVLGLLRSALEMRWEPIEVVAEGERVMVWVRNHGRHVGDFLGLPATGAEFSFEAMHCYRVEDGVVREHHAVRDDLAFQRALGLVPAPAGAAH
jgi:pimeloyl-ACP methyl ester carboxylesterase/predicted ester cyclase